MSVWRIQTRMELDPATPGMASFESKVQNYANNDAITIGLTQEGSFAQSVVITSGPPAGRRVWFYNQLIFVDRIPFDDILQDLFAVADAGPPIVYGAFLWPDRVLTVDLNDPNAEYSYIIAHECQHDAVPFVSCNGFIVAQWIEGVS